MATEIRVPALGESVTSATVSRWMKKAGEAVKADEPVVELETDKVSLEVNAPESGVISAIEADEGAEVEVGAVLGTIDPGGAATAESRPAAAAETQRVSAVAGVHPPPVPPGPVSRPATPPPDVAAQG